MGHEYMEVGEIVPGGLRLHSGESVALQTCMDGREINSVLWVLVMAVWCLGVGIGVAICRTE